MLRTTCKATHHARKPVAYVLDVSRHRERWRDRETHKRQGHLPIPRLLDHAYTPGNRQPLPPPHFRLPLPLFPSAGNTNLLQMSVQVVTEARRTRRAMARAQGGLVVTRAGRGEDDNSSPELPHRFLTCSPWNRRLDHPSSV